MRIAVVGGSQGTGAQVSQAALVAGHEVSVLSRSGTAPEGARAVQGSATDADAVREALAGADAVVVSVGGSRGAERPRAEATRTVVAVMQETGVRRLVVQSSLGAGDSLGQLPLPLRPFAKVVLAKAIADHDDQEEVVRASGLDWTIVRPSGLTDKPATGTWQARRTTEKGTLKGRITRADLAACILQTLDDPATVGAALGVSGV